MRAGMQALLALLRGQGGASVDEGAEWKAVLALADEERVLPWAAACLRTQVAVLSQETVQRLDQIDRDAAIAAFYWSSLLKSLLHALDNAKVRVVPLKGPFLAERLYGTAGLRVSRDLDILVSAEDVARAESVLSDMGFRPGEADDYHRPWRRQSAMVELHHDVENPLAFDFNIASALRRTEAAEFQGEQCRQLVPEDELLFLCLHAVRHRFERLSLVLDLQLAFEKLPVSLDGWVMRPEVVGLRNLLVLGLAMVKRMRPDVPVEFKCEMSEREAEHLEAVADGLWQRLMTSASEPLDWRTLHAFYVEMELPGRRRLQRRWRHVKILAGRVIEPDYAFAAQFGMCRPWQVRALRPLRLLSASLRPPGK